MKCFRFLVLLLMVVGSLNWGLVGLFQYDVVSSIFGGMDSMGARIVFALVGLAGLVSIRKLFGCCSGGSNGCGSGCNCNCHKKN